MAESKSWWLHPDTGIVDHNNRDFVQPRRVVVIDPATLESGPSLPQWLRRVADDLSVDATGPIINDIRTLADVIEEQVYPKPPKPDEPTGKYTEVEDAHGALYFRDPRGNWRLADNPVTARPWQTISAVKVLSRGVE